MGARERADFSALDERHQVKPLTQHKFIGDWHVRVWKGFQPTPATTTTWPLPAGPWWQALREKINNGVYLESGIHLTRQECMAIRDVIHAYANLLTTPTWRIKQLAKALVERVAEESPE